MDIITKILEIVIDKPMGWFLSLPLWLMIIIIGIIVGVVLLIKSKIGDKANDKNKS